MIYLLLYYALFTTFYKKERFICMIANYLLTKFFGILVLLEICIQCVQIVARKPKTLHVLWCK